MNLQPFLDTSPAIQIHAGLGTIAFALGAYLLVRRKGGATHRLLGRIWIGVMVVVAFSALFIHQIRTWGPFSPLHLLSLFTFASCWWAVRMARTGNAVAHARTVVGLYAGGVILAGGLTFLPGLLMHRIFLEGSDADLARLGTMAVSPLWLAMGLAVAVFFVAAFAGNGRAASRRRAR